MGVPAAGQFIPVSGSTIDLCSLKGAGYSPCVVNEDDETKEDLPFVGGASGEINLQVVDGFGATVGNYFWYDKKVGEADDPETLYGWYDINENLIEEGTVTIQPGRGFWLFCSGDAEYTCAIQSSGSVLTAGDQPVTLVQNGIFVANPTPVNVDLNNVYVQGYDDCVVNDDDETKEDLPFVGGASGEVNLQVVNSYGATVGNYFWYDKKIGEVDDPETLYGWYDINENKVDDDAVIALPGRGFWVFSESDAAGWNLYWPKVTFSAK